MDKGKMAKNTSKSLKSKTKMVLFSSVGLCLSVLVTPITIQSSIAKETENVIALDEISNKDNANPLGNYLAAQHALRKNDIKKAQQYFRSVLNNDPENANVLEQTFLLDISNGDIDQAAELAESILELNEKHRFARLVLAAKALKSREYKALERHIKAGDPQGPVAKLTTAFLKSWGLKAAGKTEEAIEVLNKLEGPDWFRLFKTYNQALILENGGKIKEAKAKFDATMETNDQYFRTIEAFSRFLARTGSTEQALETLEKREQTVGKHPMLTALKKQLKEGETPKSIISNPAEGVSEGLYTLGTALSRDGSKDLALIYLQLASYLRPKSDLILSAIADIHNSQENYQMAIDSYNKIGKSSPIYVNAQVERALNLRELDKKEEAEEILKSIVENDPTARAAAISLADFMRAEERYAEASQIYSRVIESYENADEDVDWTLYYYRGISYEREKLWPLAELDLKKALELQPNHPHVLNYLGYSWIDQGLYLDEALEMIKKAVEQLPADGYIVDSLGWAFYKLGRYEEAVLELERAVELRPMDPIINDHLGDAYWRAGRRLEARFQWEHALNMEPTEENAPLIKEKLENGLPDLPEEPAVDNADAQDSGGDEETAEKPESNG